VSLPKTIWVKEEKNPDGSKYLAAEYAEAELAERTATVIGEYRLVKTKRRRLVVANG